MKSEQCAETVFSAKILSNFFTILNLNLNVSFYTIAKHLYTFLKRSPATIIIGINA